jgi:hypothetical protein
VKDGRQNVDDSDRDRQAFAQELRALFERARLKRRRTFRPTSLSISSAEVERRSDESAETADADGLSDWLHNRVTPDNLEQVWPYICLWSEWAGENEPQRDAWLQLLTDDQATEAHAQDPTKSPPTLLSQRRPEAALAIEDREAKESHGLVTYIVGGSA